MRKAVRHVLRLCEVAALAALDGSFNLAAGIVRQRAPRPPRLLPRRVAQVLVVQTVRPTVLRGVVRQRSSREEYPATQGTGQHLLRRVLAVATQGTCSAGPSVLVRTVRSALAQGPSAQGIAQRT